LSETQHAAATRLEEAERKHAEHVKSLGEASSARIAELQRLHEGHLAERQNISGAELAEREAIHSENVADLEKKHREAQVDTERWHSQTLAGLKSQHARALADAVRSEQNTSEIIIADVEAHHSKAIAELKNQHSRAIADVEGQHAQAIVSLKSQHDSTIAQAISQAESTAGLNLANVKATFEQDGIKSKEAAEAKVTDTVDVLAGMLHDLHLVAQELDEALQTNEQGQVSTAELHHHQAQDAYAASVQRFDQLCVKYADLSTYRDTVSAKFELLRNDIVAAKDKQNELGRQRESLMKELSSTQDQLAALTSKHNTMTAEHND
ncbi:hypothetical protein LTR16_007278, partial [Cryomyces antarcticus]